MELIYSKDINENKKQRLTLLAEARNNVLLQGIIRKKCSEDPIFFFNMFLWTYKPKAVGDEGEPENPNLPFITYPFQDQFITDLIWCVENQQDNCTEKSREMGFSWMVLGALGVWGFLFRGWPGLIGSYKEDYVDKGGSMDSAFERIRYMLERLPAWMKPNDLITKFCSISSNILGAEIGGDSGENFGTGGRRKWAFLDEFALWRTDEKAFRKTKDVTNCRIFGGTPEGRFNIYGKIMTNHKDFAHLDIKKFTLHWRLHPLKTEEWYEKQKRQRTKLDLAKEIDISYDDSVTGAVYPDFFQLAQFRRVEYDADLRTYTTMDFGRDSNALIIWQKDFRKNQIYILRTIRKIGWDIEKFVAFITGNPTQGYVYTEDELEFITWSRETIRNQYSNHFGDPYNGDAKTTNAKKTIKEIFRENGLYLTLKTDSTIESRIKGATLSFKRLTVNEDETDFIQSMIQSKYPKVVENSQATTERTKPVHDENSHFRTCYEYLIDNEPLSVPDIIPSTPKTFHNKLSGRMEVTRPRTNKFGLPQR